MVSEHASPLAALGGADAGGQNVHVAALAAALAARGHQVTVFTRRDDPRTPCRVAAAPGVTVEHIDAGPARAIPKDELLPYMDAFGDRLAERWTARRPDVVHAHFWMSGLAALRGAAAAPPIPVVQTFHALGTVKRRHQGDRDTSPAGRLELERQVARTATTVVATCTDEVRELSAYGLSPEEVPVVPCGVDPASFHPGGPARPRSHSASRVLAIGRLVPRKGADTLIEALPRVPGAELLIAGGPHPRDLDADMEVRRLRRLAETHGVAGRVVLLGRVPHDEVPSLMRSADVVATVPWYEPFGIVPVEAMACGTPVVASAVGGHLDTVRSGTTGLLVPPRDPVALGAALRELLGDERRRAAMSAAGARHVRERYPWPVVAAETEQIYRRVRRRMREQMSTAETADRLVQVETR